MHANITTDEGSLNGSSTISFPWPVKRLTVMNDSGSSNLQFKFKTSHDWATLKPYETVSIDCSITQLMLLTTASVPYRVWGVG